jgi:hypothetical protein
MLGYIYYSCENMQYHVVVFRKYLIIVMVNSTNVLKIKIYNTMHFVTNVISLNTSISKLSQLVIKMGCMKFFFFFFFLIFF